jgi:hypothetical protein
VKSRDSPTNVSRRFLRQSFAFSALAALGSLPGIATSLRSDPGAAELLMIGDWSFDDEGHTGQSGVAKVHVPSDIRQRRSGCGPDTALRRDEGCCSRIRKSIEMNSHPQSRRARKRQISSLHPSWSRATLLPYEKSRFVGANFPVFRLFRRKREFCKCLIQPKCGNC